jgi:hypothetical protein
MKGETLKLTFLIWMAVSNAMAQLPPDFESLCQHFNARVEASVQHHDYSRYGKVVHQSAVEITNEPATLSMPGSQWRVERTLSVAPGLTNAFRLKLLFTLEQGDSPETSLLATLSFNKWDKSNYVLLPAAAYNGNRFESRRIAYSPKLLDPKDIGPDKPTIVSDIPRLNIHDGPSRIQEKSGSMSVPAMGFYSEGQQQVVWMLTNQESRFGDHGMLVEENRDRTKAWFSVQVPGVRELYKYRITDNMQASPDKGVNFKEGDTVSISLVVQFLPAQRLQTLFSSFVENRKYLYPASQGKKQLGFSTAFTIQEHKFNQQNWVEPHGYYAVGMRENFLQDWQIGWTGGMISTYPLLMAGHDSTRKRVVRNFDWLFPNGLAPSGFFWDSGEKGTQWYGGDIRKPHTKNWHLVRKSGDGLYYVIKQFELMKARKMAVKPAWEQGAKTVANAFVKLWNDNKQLGNFVDSETGKIVVGGSSSGAIVPAALVLASGYFKDDGYLKVAEFIGDYFFQNFTAKGLATGGPGDAMQNPDSESAFALIESYAMLFEATGDKKWLNRAEDATEQFATWVSAYNYRFPPQSLFGRTGIQSCGAVWANTQNKHGAPGICTFSGLSIFKLYRWTNRLFYSELLHDIAHGMTQYIGHPLKPIPGVQDGWMCERVSTNDWLEGIGEITYQSTWAETALMLTYAEIPGVYVDKLNKRVFAYDHVQVNDVKWKNNNVTFKLSNPTKGAIETKIWIDEPVTSPAKLPGHYLHQSKIIKIPSNKASLIVKL